MVTELKPEYLNPDLMFLSPVSAFLFYSLCVHTHACVYVRVGGCVCLCLYVCQGMLVNNEGQIVGVSSVPPHYGF